MLQDRWLCHDTALGWGARRAQGVQAAGWALGVLALGAQAGRAGQAARRTRHALGAARHWSCRQRALGRAEQAVASSRGERQAGRRRWVRAGHSAGARPGRAGWPWAVHSAYFRSVLIRYCS